MITFATQEVLLFRNAKSGDVVVGAEDKVEQCHYAAVITRAEEDLGNELTGGWKVIEVSREQRTLSLSFFLSLRIARSTVGSVPDGKTIGTSIFINLHRSRQKKHLHLHTQ